MCTVSLFGWSNLRRPEDAMASVGRMLLVLLSVRRGSGGLPDWRAIGLISFVVSVGAAVRGARRASAAVHIKGGARDAAAARAETRGRRGGNGAGREDERRPADGGGVETGDTESRRDRRLGRGWVTWSCDSWALAATARSGRKEIQCWEEVWASGGSVPKWLYDWDDRVQGK